MAPRQDKRKHLYHRIVSFLLFFAFGLFMLVSAGFPQRTWRLTPRYLSDPGRLGRATASASRVIIGSSLLFAGYVMARDAGATTRTPESTSHRDVIILGVFLILLSLVFGAASFSPESLWDAGEARTLKNPAAAEPTDLNLGSKSCVTAVSAIIALIAGIALVMTPEPLTDEEKTEHRDECTTLREEMTLAARYDPIGNVMNLDELTSMAEAAGFSLSSVEGTKTQHLETSGWISVTKKDKKLGTSYFSLQWPEEKIYSAIDRCR